MSLIDRKLLTFSTPVSSLPDDPVMSAGELKAVFDSNAANDLKPAFNGLIDDLCAPIDGVSGEDIHQQLVDVKGQLDGVVLGQIPDLSLTEAKLAVRSVSAEKLADFAVTGEKLSHGAVTREKIAPDALTDFLNPLNSRISGLEYHQYQLYLQSYYDSKNLPKKALFFDGFSDLAMTESGATLVDTANKKLRTSVYIDRAVQLQGMGNHPLNGTTSSGNAKLAQGFRLTGALTSEGVYITVKLSKSGSPIDNVTCKITSSFNNYPMTTLYTSETLVAGTALTSTLTDYMFNFANVTLSAGTDYFILIERSGAGNLTDFYNTGCTYGDNYPNGYMCWYINPGYWQGNSSYDMYFKIQTITHYGAVYQTLNQPLLSDCTKATLFLRKSSSNADVTPTIALFNDGDTIALQSMERDPSYISPAFSASTDIEEKWEYFQEVPKQNAKLHLSFGSQNVSGYVKAYGVITGG